MKRKTQAGFTLIELMVVVAIIGVLAAIGIPQMLTFIKAAETTEATEEAGRIAKALRGYQDARGIDAATAATNLNGKTLNPQQTGTLTSVIPHLQINTDANFKYTINTVAVSGLLQYCILAEPDGTNNTNPGSVLFSSTPSAVANWEGHTSRIAYVSGGTSAHTAGGFCNADGSVSAADQG